jgi:hypothetical protein
MGRLPSNHMPIYTYIHIYTYLFVCVCATTKKKTSNPINLTTIQILGADGPQNLAQYGGPYHMVGNGYGLQHQWGYLCI